MPFKTSYDYPENMKASEKITFEKIRDLYKRANIINCNLQHPIVQPPTPTMVPWLPKQLKEKFG